MELRETTSSSAMAVCFELPDEFLALPGTRALRAGL